MTYDLWYMTYDMWSLLYALRLLIASVLWFIDLIPWCFHIYSWSPLTIWPQGVIVKHSKASYKAVGKQNTAVPGDGPQSRLHVRSFLITFISLWSLIWASSSIACRFTNQQSYHFLFLVYVWQSTSFNKLAGVFTTHLGIASTLPPYLCLALAPDSLDRRYSWLYVRHSVPAFTWTMGCTGNAWRAWSLCWYVNARQYLNLLISCLWYLYA